MKKFMVYSLLILLVGLFFVQCSSQGENAVVTIEDRIISVDNVKEVLKRKYPKSENYQDIDLAVKKELLEPLITKNLKICAAYDMGLDEDKKFQNMLANQKIRLMGSKYYEMMIIDKLVPESEIEKVLTRQGVELKTRHILIGYEGSRRPANRDKNAALKLANDIIEEIEGGADFGDAAIKYSEDPSAKKNKGDLGYFTWGRMVGPFQEAAWDLKIGQVSAPVETVFGYHIIKLEDRRDVPNYEPDRSSKNIVRVKQTLAKAQNDSARVRWLKHYTSLKKKYQYVLYEDSIKYVSEMLDEKGKVEKIIPGAFTSAQREITFAEYEDGIINLGFLIDKYEDKLAKAFARFSNQRVLNQEIERESMNRLVMLAVEDAGIDQRPDIVKEMNKFSDQQMSKMIEQEQVTGPINPTDKEIEDYYNLHKDTFVKGAEIELWEIYITDEKLAKDVAKKARNGVNFEQLVRAYTEDKSMKKKSGYLGYKSVNSRGTISREAHKLGPGGKIGGPSKYRRGWSIYKTGKMTEEVQLSFEEVKDQAKNKLTREQAAKAKTDWVDSLKETYSVVIDEEKLKEI